MFITHYRGLGKKKCILNYNVSVNILKRLCLILICSNTSGESYWGLQVYFHYSRESFTRILHHEWEKDP